MLTVAKLTQGQEQYYERSVAQGLDDYYAGRGESPGVWTGRGAQHLGLEGVVLDGHLGLLCRGRDPLTDDQLRRPARERTITVERINPYAGTSCLEKKRLAPVCGFDLVFSAPKSVSLLHALGDQHVRHEVNQAHLSAWQAALAYLEDEACVVRKGKNGIERERGEGFVAAAYQHRTSRAEDPQLHTHVIVANMVRTPSDGKWRALDGEALLKTYRLAAGYMYQAHLRHELAARLGVEWRDTVKGMAEIQGFPVEALREFSRRRIAVEQHMTEQDSSGYYAGRVAAVVTRERKREIDLPAAIEEWKERAESSGLGKHELLGTLHRTDVSEPSRDDLVAISKVLAGPTGLTARRTAFSEPELVMAWAERAGQGLPADRLRRVADRFLQLDVVQEVTSPSGAGRPARFSTTELIDTEREALAQVDDGVDIGAPTAPVVSNPNPDGLDLSAEQIAVASHATSSPDRVVCVVGHAGAGKTTAMRAVSDSFRAAGIDVLGAAPSAVAARKLAEGTGVPAVTLHRLNQTEVLPERSVLLVDEASMADTRVLAQTLRLAADAEAKVVLVGDPHQLPAVGAGGLFAAIVERHGAAELTENRRQRDPLERAVLERLRDGVGRKYLAHAQRTERLVQSDDPISTRARLLADWWEHARSDPAENVMIALKRRDVDDLNRLAHRLMDTAGLLGAERLQTRHGELAVGDRVVCKRNDNTFGVANGTRGTVRQLDLTDRSLAIQTDDGGELRLPNAYVDAGNIRHAYALTGHATQGITVDRAFVLATGESRLQEWGYVVLSRARGGTKLYVTSPVAREVESHASTEKPPEPLARLAQSLEESQRERLAIDQAPHDQGPRHDVAPVVERPILGEVARERLRLLDRERVALERTRELAAQGLGPGRQRRPALRLGGRATRKRDAKLQREAIEQAERRLALIEKERLGLAGIVSDGTPAPRTVDRPGRNRALELGR